MSTPAAEKKGIIFFTKGVHGNVTVPRLLPIPETTIQFLKCTTDKSETILINMHYSIYFILTACLCFHKVVFHKQMLVRN